MLLTNESLILNFECTLVFTNIHRMLQFLNLMETNQNFSDINFYHKIYITVWLCSFDHVMVNQTYLKTHSKKMIKILSTINRKLFCPHILIQLENNIYLLTLKNNVQFLLDISGLGQSAETKVPKWPSTRALKSYPQPPPHLISDVSRTIMGTRPGIRPLYPKSASPLFWHTRRVILAI